jgi:hypothetical protein
MLFKTISIIANQVQRLGRPGHHRQPEIAVHDQRFDATDPSNASAPNRADQQDARSYQPLVRDAAKSRLS